MYLPQEVCGDFWELSVLQHEEPTQILSAIWYEKREIKQNNMREGERSEMRNRKLIVHINQGFKNTSSELEYLK